MTNYLNEAFKKLSVLDEDIFEVDDDGITALKDFVDEDDKDDSLAVIDMYADDKEDLEDSYVGKVVCDCCVCHSKVFWDKDAIELDDDGELVNVGSECPYCYATDGFKIMGEVKEYCPECDDKHDEDEHEEEHTEDEVEVEIKDKEKITEAKDNWIKKAREKGLSFKDLANEYKTETGIDVYDSNATGKQYSRDFIEWVKKSYLSEEKITEAVSKRDDIDAEADDKKERIKKILARKRDDADSDRDYRLKKGITRRDESCKESKSVGFDGKTVEDMFKEVKGKNFVVFDEDGYFTKEAEDAYNDVAKRFGEDEFDELCNQEHCFRESCKGKGKIKSKKELTEAPIYDLKPQFDSRQSFYGKAKVDTGDTNDKNRLYSYDTLVAEIVDGKPVIHTDNEFVVNGRYSPTTMRHIRDWLKQNGFKADTAKQIMADYSDKKTESCKESAEKFDAFYVVKDDVWEDMFDNKNEAIAFAKKNGKDKVVHTVNTKDDKGEIGFTDLSEVVWDKDTKTESCKESIDSVSVDTGAQIIDVTTRDKDEDEHKEEGEEVLGALDDETKTEIIDKAEGNYDDVEVDVDEFEEKDFDELGERYLKKAYENVDKYHTTKVSLNKDSLMVEGVITFKSGKQKKTNFVLESKNITKDGTAKFIGENAQICKGKKAFTVCGRIDNKKFLPESLNYNYRAKDASTGIVKRIYGTVKVGSKAN